MLIVLQCLDPRVNIGGMAARIVEDASLAGEEHTGDLCAKLLSRIVQITELVRLREGRTIQPRRMSGPMRELVKCRAVIAGCMLERIFARQVNRIGGSVIKGVVCLIHDR